MWDCYNAILKAMENYTIDTVHYSETKKKTSFLFRNCCGGDIVREALEYLNNKR